MDKKEVGSYAVGYLGQLAMDTAIFAVYIPLAMLAGLAGDGQIPLMVVAGVVVGALHALIIRKTDPHGNVSGRLCGGVGMVTIITGGLIALFPSLGNPLPLGLYLSSAVLLMMSIRKYVTDRRSREREEALKAKLAGRVKIYAA